MKVILQQHRASPYHRPFCKGRGYDFGRATFNPATQCAEVEVPVEEWADAKKRLALYDNLRRPGHQWLPRFELNGDAPKADQLAQLQQENAELRAKLAASTAPKRKRGRPFKTKPTAPVV